MKKPGAKSLRKAAGGATGLLIVLAILVAANVILGNMRLRADLTEEKLYTLSGGTRGVLKGLDGNVTLKLFFNQSSPEVPVFLKNYAKEIQDLLAEYRLASGGRIVVETHDPKPDSEAEEWAARYGIPSQQIAMLGPSVCLGLVAVSGSAEATIPVLDPRMESSLEYEITRLIYRVRHAAKPVVGVLSSLPVLGSRVPPQFAMPDQQPAQQPPWLAFQDLRETCDLREIEPSAEEIPADVTALVVVHPKQLSDGMMFALDQFVLRGGRLLAFLDPFSVADAETGMGGMFGNRGGGSDLAALLKAWGVAYDPSRVVADLRAATAVRGADNRVEQSPMWLSLRTANLDRKDMLTAQLEAVMMPYAGCFKVESSADLKAIPLIASSDSAGLVDSMSARFGNTSIRRDFKPEPTRVSLAVRLSGKFKTAFPDGKPGETPPAEPEKKEGGDAAKKEGGEKKDAGLKEGQSLVILVGDADMLADRFCVQEMSFFGFSAHQPMNNNLDFLANAVEQISGSPELVSIRSRGRFARPFDRVLALEADARREWQAREDSLADSLQETQRQLRSLQTEKDSTQRVILSQRQKEAIAKFRQEEARIKGELKEVRKSLRRDIERLGVTVKAVNIAGMPLLVCLAGVGYGLFRRRKR
jgi:ABC-type uncharacterized transport system involved in gliding motility auxiliary subunit